MCMVSGCVMCVMYIYIQHIHIHHIYIHHIYIYGVCVREWYGSVVYMCCMCECVCVSRYMCNHLHKDNRGQFGVITQVHLVCFLLLFFRQDL